jgi:hypothetical protein
MRRMLTSGLVVTAIFIAAGTLAAAPASATPTCGGGRATCLITLRTAVGAPWTLTVAGSTVSCDVGVGITVITGNDSMSLTSSSLNNCATNFGCTFSGFFSSLSSWIVRLSSSRPTSGSSYPIGLDLGGVSGRSTNCRGSRSTLTLPTQRPSCTTTSSIDISTTLMSISCTGITYTATGGYATVLGASGTTMTMTLAGTYTPAITIS